jgi:hypothetical protein
MDPIAVNNETVTKIKEQLNSVLKNIDESLTFHDFRMTPKGENRTNLLFDVVIPAGFKMSESEIEEKIVTEMREKDKTFFFVITFDRDYTGVH